MGLIHRLFQDNLQDMSGQKKIWMVRIGDHMCGPYETATVESLIKEQKISEIDEIALPCKGWNYVRDRGEFIGTLETLKSNSFSAKYSKTGESTGTENITQLSAGERTEELTLSKMQDIKTHPLIEFDSVSVKLKKENVVSRPGTGRTPVKSSSKRMNKVVPLLIFVLLLGGFVLFLFGDAGTAYSPLSLLKGQGGEAFRISLESGNYEEAFKILNGNKSLLTKNRNEFAAVVLLRGDEFNRAEKTLNSVVDKVSAEWKNLKGLSEQYKGKLEKAESYYLSVLKKAPNYIPSLVNLGLLKREAGEWSLSRAYFESAFSKVKESGFEGVSFYLLEAWMRQELAETGLSKLSDLDSYLQNQMVGNTTYMHEFKLVELWMNTARGVWPKKENVLLKEILDLDPYVLLERKVNLFTYRLPVGALSYLCSDLKEKLRPSKYKTPVVSLCFIVDRNYKEAVVELKKDLRGEYALALYSFASKLNKDVATSEEYLAKVMELKKNKSLTKFFLQARFCYEKGDMKCAAEYWMKALDRDPNAYTAHTGLAKSYFQVEDYEKARTFMKRAEGFTDSYGPLIELQMLMEKVKQ